VPLGKSARSMAQPGAGLAEGYRPRSSRPALARVRPWAGAREGDLGALVQPTLWDSFLAAGLTAAFGQLGTVEGPIALPDSGHPG
jgi:hypothetical protein